MIDEQERTDVTSVILVVDDNEANRYAKSRILRHAGYTVIEAGTGTEALEKVASARPPLVCLDVKLPDVSGYEVCRQIKADPQNRTLVLQISASFIGRDDKVKGLEGGADGYLISPVQPTELLATVRSFLRIQRAEERLREAARQWRCTFDAIRDGIAVVDVEERVLRCNAALTRIIGRSFDDMLGRPLHDLLAIPELFASTVTGGRGVTITIGGRWYEVTVDRVRDVDAAPTTVWIFTDITDRRAHEEEIRTLNAALKQRIDELQRSRAQLQEKINDLERFEDVVVGRELKMMELEHEVKRLKSRYEPERL